MLFLLSVSLYTFFFLVNFLQLYIVISSAFIRGVAWPVLTFPLLTSFSTISVLFLLYSVCLYLYNFSFFHSLCPSMQFFLPSSFFILASFLSSLFLCTIFLLISFTFSSAFLVFVFFLPFLTCPLLSNSSTLPFVLFFFLFHLHRLLLLSLCSLSLPFALSLL